MQSTQVIQMEARRIVRKYATFKRIGAEDFVRVVDDNEVTIYTETQVEALETILKPDAPFWVWELLSYKRLSAICTTGYRRADASHLEKLLRHICQYTVEAYLRKEDNAQFQLPF